RSEPAAESPWGLSSAPAMAAASRPAPELSREGSKIELSLVAAIATGALAFCVVLGAYFYSRPEPKPFDEMTTAGSAPAFPLESPPPAVNLGDAKSEAKTAAKETKAEPKGEAKTDSKKPKPKPVSDDAAPAPRKPKTETKETKNES